MIVASVLFPLALVAWILVSAIYDVGSDVYWAGAVILFLTISLILARS